MLSWDVRHFISFFFSSLLSFTMSISYAANGSCKAGEGDARFSEAVSTNGYDGKKYFQSPLRYYIHCPLFLIVLKVPLWLMYSPAERDDV